MAESPPAKENLEVSSHSHGMLANDPQVSTVQLPLGYPVRFQMIIRPPNEPFYSGACSGSGGLTPYDFMRLKPFPDY